ncbi:MAG TPA: ABC transporter permease, partial [Steroidobacter sp.]|nr:ABC transporter permease [Steroidobacter sp.]
MREALRRILILCRKETLAIFKDPRSRIILFVPVVLQSLLFGYAASYDLDHAPYALLDEDRSAASRELVERIEAGGVFRRVADLRTASEIAPVINRREALFVLHIGPQFERTLSGGAEAPVQVLLDGRNTNTAATAAGYLRAMVESFNARWREERGAVGPAVNVQTRAWYNENLETRWHMIPSLVAALSMLQTLMLTALSVAREREQGTFDQLLVTPCTPTEIMIGKSVPSILVGLV